MTATADLGLLEAGALVDRPAGEASVPVSARAYTHRVLEDRVVVRLVPDPLAPAEDLALDVLGLEPAGATPLGHGRRRALGFPAWALVNDPANARHALALVKELERVGRLARGRPGAAKDQFEALAARLGRSAPHFLPTFLEQAGRAYLEAGNRPLAATMFGKAREAERAHALPIDEERDRDVFLEFAFAGALSAKALTEQARQLAARAVPADAYALFRRLCVERVLGGLPPYAGMAVDLRRLAKAAGLDPAAEAAAIALELLDAPATVEAAAGFWSAYAPALTAAARRDGAVAARLARVFPTRVPTAEWLELLEAAGAIDQLAADPAAAATWLEHLARLRTRGWRATPRSERLLALVERLAPVLAAAGRPLDLAAQTPWSADPDLLDLAIDLGLPVADPGRPDGWLDIGRWRRDGAPGRRPLAALAADARYGPLLRHGLGQAINGLRRWNDDSPLSQADLGALLTAPGVRSAMHDHVERLADGVDQLGLPDLRDRLRQLEPLRSRHGLAVNPAAVARLAAADPAALLAATLRAGILDELGWPALEAALGRLARSRSGRWRAFDAWPALIVSDGVTAVVAGPGGIELEHALRFPAGSRRQQWRPLVLAWAGGQLLVRWTDEGRAWSGYWSDRPGQVFACAEPEAWSSAVVPSLPLPGGGRTSGGRAMLPGDTQVSPKRTPVCGDGQAVWRLDHGKGGWQWRELDPATGTVGRASLPGWLDEAAGARAGRLRPELCRLAPLPPGLEGTPLGTAGGMIGWRVLLDDDGVLRGEGIDGRTASLPSRLPVPLRGERELAGRLRLPGGAELSVAGRLNQAKLLDDAGGTVAELRLWDSAADAPGTPMVVGPDWWHCLRPRDPGASARLRQVRAADLAPLLQAAGAAGAGADDEVVPTAAEAAALARLLPGCGDRGLLAGVAGLARGAARIAATCRELTSLLAEADAGPVLGPAEPEAPAAADGVLGAAVAGLVPPPATYRSSDPAGPNALHQVAATGAMLAGERAKAAGLLGSLLRRRQPAKAAVDWPRSEVVWAPLVGTPGALLWRASSPVTPAEQRDALLALLDAMAAAGLLGGDRVRTLTVTQPEAGELVTGQLVGGQAASAVVVGQAAWGTWDVASGRSRDSKWWVVEAGRRSGPVGGLPVDGAEPLAGRPDAGAYQLATAAARAGGPLAWDPAWPERLAAATGLSRAEAALLLAGLPGLETWYANFLPKATRELLGLKATEAKAAKATLMRLAPAVRRQLLAALVPADPARLLADGPDLDALAAAYAELVGVTASIPDELLVAANRALPGTRDTAATLRGLADPAGCDWLRGDGFSGQRLIEVATALPWLAAQLPLGDRLRPALAAAFAALQERLADPALVLAAGMDTGGTLRATFGLPGSSGKVTAGPGITIEPGHWGQDQLELVPARLSAGDLDRLRTLSTLAPTTWMPTHQLDALLVARSPGLAALAARLAEPPAPGSEGRWDQDPRVSAPATVAAAEAELRVGPDAAALYLQTLALPDPTAKLVQRWNGWAPAAYKRAEAALVEAGHLVKGARARAGRASFLPGGWLALRAPDLPMEVWKAPLLDPGSGDRPSSRLGRVLVAEPFGDLFARAWARRADQPPGLEALDTSRRR